MTTLEHVDLELTGMTCAACANRIEKKLNKLEGVTASVNYATEKASVDFDLSSVSADELVAAVESIGYGAVLPKADEPAVPTVDPADERLADLRRRMIVAIALGIPVLLVSMIPALQFRGWQWLALALATPVAEAVAYARKRRIKHVDASSWSLGGQLRALWTIATSAVTVFFVAADQKTETIAALMRSLRGFLVTDRGSTFGLWAMELHPRHRPHPPHREGFAAHAARTAASHLRNLRPPAQEHSFHQD